MTRFREFLFSAYVSTRRYRTGIIYLKLHKANLGAVHMSRARPANRAVSILSRPMVA